MQPLVVYYISTKMEKEKKQGESLRNSHSQEELKEAWWWLNVMWYPGTEKGHMVKTKETE